MTDERYRYCVYCGADCTLGWDMFEGPPGYKPPHTEDCPSRTGIFPVRDEDLHPHGMVCCRCDTPFSVGDRYMHLPIDETPEVIPIVEVVCVGCAAEDQILNLR